MILATASENQYYVVSLVYVKTLLMTGIWIASWLENNEVVSFKTLLIHFRVRKICKILSTMIIKLNAILTSKFTPCQSKEYLLSYYLSLITPTTLKLDLASKKVEGKVLVSRVLLVTEMGFSCLREKTWRIMVWMEMTSQDSLTLRSGVCQTHILTLCWKKPQGRIMSHTESQNG